MSNDNVVGVELQPLPGRRPGETAGAVMASCLRRGLLIMACGPYDCLRFMPALNIGMHELADGMRIFTEAVEEVLTASAT